MRCDTQGWWPRRSSGWGARLAPGLALAFAATGLFSGATEAAHLPGQVIMDPNNKAWLVYNKDADGDGKLDPCFLCGPGGPESFLHKVYSPGWDQDSIIDFIIQHGGNTMVVTAVRSHGGDGDSTQNPWIDHDPKKGLDPQIIAKWEVWLTRLENAGIVIYFQLYDDGVGHIGDDFVRDIVNAFEHHELLVWCIGEEYYEAISKTMALHIRDVIRQADDYDHPIGADQKGTSFDFAGELEIFGTQGTADNPDTVHGHALSAWDHASQRYARNFNGHHYFTPDANGGRCFNDGDIRRGIWALAMGAGYFMNHGLWEYDKGQRKPPTEGMCRAYRILHRFFESTNFSTMAPHDELAHGGTKWVLADPGQSYIAYAPNLSGNIGLKNMTAVAYDFTWLDCTDGTTVNQTGVNVPAGDGTWSKSAGIGNHLAVWIRRSGGGGPTNRPPTASDVNVATESGETLEITLQGSDPDGDSLTYTIMTQPSHGSLSGETDGNRYVTYAASSSYVGADTFTYKVTDGEFESSAATVTVTVEAPVNDAPAAQDQSFTTMAGQPVAVFLQYDDPDGPGPFTVTITEDPAHGTLSGVNNDRTYAPESGFTGADTFRWKVNDGELDSSIATVAIDVYADSDGDGLPDDWEETYGLDPNAADTDGDGVADPDEDPDGDGLTNLEEFEAGTDPTAAGGVSGGGGLLSCARGDGRACATVGWLVLVLALIPVRRGLRPMRER